MVLISNVISPRAICNTGHLIVTGLQFQRFSTLSSWQEAGQCIGRPDAREGDENSISCSKGRQKDIVCCRQPEGDSLSYWVDLSIETSKPIPTVAYFLQQGHNYFRKAIPANSALFNHKHINNMLSWMGLSPEVPHPLISLSS